MQNEAYFDQSEPTRPLDAARARYARLGETWLEEFRVTLRKARTNLSGRGCAQTRQIVGPWPPTTRQRLYIIAHEIGHVVLDHRRQRPAYVREFEAEQFAHALLHREGIAVPRKQTLRAKAYVLHKIYRGLRRGRTKALDPFIADWADMSLLSVSFDCSKPSAWTRDYTESMQRVRVALGS